MEADKQDNLKKQHKDTLFRMYFKETANFLHLLEYCGRTNLTAEDIMPFDLESAVALRIRRNDVSFITKDNRIIILIEHQSTINPNMAFRMFLYYVELLQLWLKLNKINIFGEAKIENLPVPEFYVAYNGTEPLPEKVSTFQLEHEGIKINVTVNIVDIRFENLHNIEADNALTGYSFFYKVYDEGKKAGLSGEEAFKIAREQCIEHGHMKGFIEKEDYIMFYKDFLDYDKQLEAEAEAKGKAKGKAEGAEKTISVAIRSKVPFSVIESMAKEADVSNQRLTELMEQIAV